MHTVLVLSTSKKPLMPCRPARARKLLNKGKAKVYRTYPFVIILNEEKEIIPQKLEIKIDPGSKTTGIVLVAHYKRGAACIWAEHLDHRGPAIKKSLGSRRGLRNSRRQRKTRYRPPRFDNRRRCKGWLPPSLQSRVDNIVNFTNKHTFDPTFQVDILALHNQTVLLVDIQYR